MEIMLINLKDEPLMPMSHVYEPMTGRSSELTISLRLAVSKAFLYSMKHNQRSCYTSIDLSIRFRRINTTLIVYFPFANSH